MARRTSQRAQAALKIASELREREREKYAATQSDPIHAAEQRGAFLAGIMCGVPINACLARPGAQSGRGRERERKEGDAMRG